MNVYFYDSCLKISLTHVKCTIWKINYKHLYYFKLYMLNRIAKGRERREERGHRSETSKSPEDTLNPNGASNFTIKFKIACYSRGNNIITGLASFHQERNSRSRM